MVRGNKTTATVSEKIKQDGAKENKFSTILSFFLLLLQQDELRLRVGQKDSFARRDRSVSIAQQLYLV